MKKLLGRKNPITVHAFSQERPHHSYWSVMDITLHEWGSTKVLRGACTKCQHTNRVSHTGLLPGVDRTGTDLLRRAEWIRIPLSLASLRIASVVADTKGRLSQAGELTALSRSQDSAMEDTLASPTALLTVVHARRICALPRSSSWHHLPAIPFPVALPSRCRHLNSTRDGCHQGWPKASCKQSLSKAPEEEPPQKLNHRGNDTKAPPPLGKGNK